MLRLLISSLVLVTVLSACSKGIDKKPDLTTIDNYKPRINADFAEASTKEVDAYNFAVSDLSFENLRASYQNKSYREIANEILTKYMNDLQAGLQEAESRKPEYEKKLKTLDLIHVEVQGVTLTHDTFFDKRDVRYTFKVMNNSSLPLSKIQLNASFGINKQKNPLYTWEPVVSFEEGLRPGQSVTFSANMVGFLSFDKPITIEVREAKSLDVQLEVTDAADFSETWLIGRNSLFNRLQTFPPKIQEAKEYLSVLKK